MFLSNLLEKQIVENVTANNLGKLCKIHINKNCIDYIKTSTDNTLCTNQIIAINDTIITQKSERNYPDFKFFTLSNQQIITEKGKICGILSDLMLSKDFKITKIITNGKNIANAEILSISEDNLIIKKTSKQPSVKQTKLCEDKMITTVSNYSFLIGRILQKDLHTNGQIVLKAGTKICKTDIDTAVRYGKLIDLTIYSKFYNIENL